MLSPGGDPPPAWGSGTRVDEAGQLHTEVNGKELVASLRKYLGGATSGPRLDEVFYVTLAKAQPPVPVLAHLEYHGDEARLVPQVPLSRGQDYVVVFDFGKVTGRDREPERTEITVPADSNSSASRVTTVFPGQETLPANLLKFYVHFSEPMSEGKLFDHVRLLDGSGKPVTQAFREVELWSDHHRRVTLWINPGRTKQALGLSESLGPVLVPNRNYTLEIGAGLPDDRGRPLAQPFRLRFRTAAADHTQPSIATWQFTTPPAGTREPLRVRFAEPLDHALAQDGLAVETVDGRRVPGRAEVDVGSTSWSFTPDEPWRSGSYRVTAAGEVEDLAGNSLYRAFETRAGQGAKPTATPPVFRREFAVP